VTQEANIWYVDTPSEVPGHTCISRSSGQGPGHRSRNASLWSGTKFRMPWPRTQWHL